MDIISWGWLSRMGWDGARRAGVDVGTLSILSTHLSGLMRHWSIEPFMYDSRASVMQFSLIRPCAHSHNKWTICVDVSFQFWDANVTAMDWCLNLHLLEIWAVISLRYGQFTMMSTMKLHCFINEVQGPILGIWLHDYLNKFEGCTIMI